MMTRWMKQASAWPFEVPVALFLGAAVAFFLMAMPEELFEGYFAASGLPLLGIAGRIVAAFGLGGAAAWGTWRGLSAVGLPNDRWTIKVSRPSFTPRRADAHPDAPLRRPIFAGSELGAPLDSVQAPPRRRRKIGTARSDPPEVPEVALEEAPVPAAFAARSEIAEVVAPAPIEPPVVEQEFPLEPEVNVPLAPEPPSLEAAGEPPVAEPAGRADEDQERDSIAALMQRLEDRLARHSAHPEGRSAPAAWLVRNDDETAARKSA